MPVRRLRSLQEAEESVWLDRADPRLVPTIREVWRLADRMSPPSYPPGVYKHRSIEELNAQTEAWECANVAARARSLS
jgi:hypothetical protein